MRETGVSAPDIASCVRLAEIFDISLEQLIQSKTKEEDLAAISPHGKFVFGPVQVGADGHISLPSKAMELLEIHPGDTLIAFGDMDQGIALVNSKNFSMLVQRVQDAMSAIDNQ